MRIVSIAARTIRWPITARGAARGCTERTAVLVEVRSDRGAIGLGEAAPLPGMSRDALEQVEQAIGAFAGLAPFELARRDAPRSEARDGGPILCEILDRPAAHAFAAAPPAARFAIETALLDAIARELQVSIAALLCAWVDSNVLLGAHVGTPPCARSDAPRNVPLAAVVDDPDAARRAFAAGIRCFKIKLTAADDVDRVFAIAAAAPGARLRIDANRSWPRAEVADRLAVLAPLPIDYVEEPCREAHRLLSSPLPCKLALDESLGELSRDDLLAALRGPGLAAVILKPTLLGGLSAALALAALARRFGVAPVASHALEGPIGTAACAELALALGDEHPAGLAPHPALAGWSIEVEQLAADHVRAVAAPGLGFVGLDLAGIVHAGPRLPP
ncbi:MAG TPA: enolase C-terminal domain-like protein [Kofleriaceae bacterium]